MMSAYAIQSSVSIVVDGWTRTRQNPTFYLDKNVQGIVNEKHAEAIAFDIINPLRDENLTVNVSATYVGSVGG